MIRKAVFFLMLACSLLLAQSNILQEDQDFRFAGQLAAKGMQDLAALQFLKFAGDYATSPRAPEALFRAAEAYETLPEAGKALSIYLQLILQYPQSTFIDQALFNRARLLSAAGQSIEAALSYERLRLFVPKSALGPQALLSASREFLKAGETQRSLDAVLAFLEQYPTDPLRFEARYLMASIRFQEHKPLLALQELDRILGERVEGDMAVKANYLRGRTLYEMGRYRLADSIFQTVLQNAPAVDSTGAMGLYYARLLHHRGDYQNSKRIVGALLDKHPQIKERAELLLLQGDNQYALAEYQPALESYSLLRDAALPKGTAEQVLIRQALTLLKLQRPQDALQKYQSLLAKPDSALGDKGLRQFALIESSRLLCSQGNPADALRLVRRYINHPGFQSDELLLTLAEIQKNYFKDYIAAGSAYTTLLELYPQSPLQDDALFALAHCHEQQGRLSEAIAVYEKYLASFPAADQVQQAQDRIYYLRHFKPAPAAEMQVQLQQFIVKQFSTADKSQLALSWAEKLIYAFHDYQQAVPVLNGLKSGKIPVDIQQRAFYLQGLCHLYLAKKSAYDDQADRRRAHLDSLQQIVTVLQESGQAGDLADQLFVEQWNDHKDPAQRMAFANDSTTQKIKSTLTDSMRALVELQLADSYYQAAGDSGGGLLLHSARICRSLTTGPQTPQPETLALQGDVYRRLQKPDSAVLAYQQLLRVYPNHPRAVHALWHLAGLKMQQGQWADALPYYEDIARQFYYCDLARRAEQRICEVLFKLGKLEQAQTCLDRALTMRSFGEMALFFPSKVDDELLWISAQTQEALGNPALAIKAYQDYYLQSAAGARRPAALLRMAELSTQLGFSDAATGHYEELLSRYAQDSLAVVALRRLADSYFDRGLFNEAKKNYLLLKNSPDPEAQTWAATREVLCEFRLNNFARAKTMVEVFKKQYANRSSEAQFMLTEAELQLSGKEFKNAETLFKEVSSKYKETPEAVRGDLGLARLYIILNKNEDALKILIAIPEKYRDAHAVGAAYVTLGEFYYANQQFENCIAAGRKAYELKEAPQERAQAMQLLIRVYDDVRMWDRAIALLREYLQTYPNADDVMMRKVQLGIFLINMKEYERAIAYLKDLKWLVDAETEAEVQYWIAKSFNERGQPQEAIIEYLKVKYLCAPTKLPWGTTAVYEAGQAYYKLGELGKARFLFLSIVRELGAADQFGRVAADRVQEIDAEMAQSGKKS